MAYDSLPWGFEGQVDPPDMFEDRWRVLWSAGPNAVVSDFDGTSLQVTAPGTSTEVNVAAGAAVVQGVNYLQDSPETLDVAEFGTAPTSGQTRIDVVILRCDYLDQSVIPTVKAGTPAASGAVPPPLTRDPDGVWEEPLATVTRVGPTAVTGASLTDRRRWAGTTFYSADLPTPYPLGATAIVGRDLYLRRIVSGSPAWYNLTNPPWQPLTLSGNYQGVGSRAPRWRVRGGMVELDGQIQRVGGVPFVSGTSPTVFALPAGARDEQMVHRHIIGAGGNPSALLMLETLTNGAGRFYLPGGTPGVTSGLLSGVSFPIFPTS